MSMDGRAGGVTSTNAEGRFEIKELSAGRYSLMATKGGFVSLQYGQRRPSESGTPIELGDGQTLDKLTVALPRGSVLGGRVTDEFGEPVANATVVVFPANEKQWTYPSRFISATRPDQEGRYRLTALPPGEDYLVVALQGLEDGQAGGAEFLATMRDLAAKFSLADGETKAVDVTLSTRP